MAALIEDLRLATPPAALSVRPQGLVSYLQVAGITPPTPPPPEGKKAKKFTAKLVVTGSSNDLVQYGRVPRIYGKRRYAPPLAALPIEEPEGSKSFLRLLFTFGYGPLKLTDLKIGDTPIDAFSGVEYEIREGRPGDTPVTIYPDLTGDDLLDAELKKDSWVSRETQGEVDSFAIDILFPDGCAEFTSSGSLKPETVKVRMQYRKAGAAWPTSDNINKLVVTETTRTAFTRSVKVSVTKAKYEIRVMRESVDATTNKTTRTKWSSLRSFTNGSPVALSSLCLVAMRIQGTKQLSGIVDKFHAQVESYLIDWNGVSWAERLSRNAAAVFRDLCQKEVNKRPVADAAMDLATIQAWAEANTAAGRNFDFIFDDEGTLEERLRFVAAAGRASLAFKDGGKYSVVRDILQTPTAPPLFTPANSWAFRASKAFVDRPHALKVTFTNPAKGDADDERLVYDDGYTVANATKFERLDLPWCSSADTAWKEGRYFIAAGRLRPETFELEVDFEHFPVTRGDLVRVNHDVILVGTGHGRLKSVTVDGGGNCTSVVLDNAVTMESAKTYACGVLRADGLYVVGSVVLNVGEQTTISFSPAIPAASGPPKVGTVFAFGEATKESAEYLVQGIRMLPRFAARLTLVDAAPGVHSAETGTIPGYDPKITVPPPAAQPVAASAPQALSVQATKETVQGATKTPYLGGVKILLGKKKTGKAALKKWAKRGSA